jgi:hypothetical protein
MDLVIRRLGLFKYLDLPYLPCSQPSPNISLLFNIYLLHLLPTSSINYYPSSKRKGNKKVDIINKLCLRSSGIAKTRHDTLTALAPSQNRLHKPSQGADWNHLLVAASRHQTPSINT